MKYDIYSLDLAEAILRFVSSDTSIYDEFCRYHLDTDNSMAQYVDDCHRQEFEVFCDDLFA